MFCFLCNSVIKSPDKFCHIFKTRICEKNGTQKESLFSVLCAIFGTSHNLDENSVYSKAVCLNCVKMINLYEVIREEYFKIKCKIINKYNKTAQFYGSDLVILKNGKMQQHIKQLQEENLSYIDDADENERVEYLCESPQNNDDCIVNVFGDEKSSSPRPETISDDLQFYQIIEFDDSKNINDEDDREENYIPNETDEIEVDTKLENINKQSNDDQLGWEEVISIQIGMEEDFSNPVDNGNGKYNCDKCTESFPVYELLQNHEKIHVIKPYCCNICNKTFAHRSNLSTHIRTIHLKEYSYSCNICGDGFSRKRQLECHIRTSHTGERPFQCNICSSSFAYPHIYARHLQIHAGIKYPCEICGKTFNSRDNRNSHRYIHSDRKRYECSSCGIGFMKKFLLQTHITKTGHTNASESI